MILTGTGTDYWNVLKGFLFSYLIRITYKLHHSRISIHICQTGTTQTAGAWSKGGKLIGQLCISLVPHLVLLFRLLLWVKRDTLRGKLDCTYLLSYGRYEVATTVCKCRYRTSLFFLVDHLNLMFGERLARLRYHLDHIKYDYLKEKKIIVFHRRIPDTHYRILELSNIHLSCTSLGMVITRFNITDFKIYTCPSSKITCQGDSTSVIFVPCFSGTVNAQTISALQITNTVLMVWITVKLIQSFKITYLSHDIPCFQCNITITNTCNLHYACLI